MLPAYWLLTLSTSAIAAKWTVDPSCEKFPLKGDVTLDIRMNIKNAMAEAVDMAANAFEAIDRFSGDSKVREICEIALGDDPTKLAQAKATFASLMVYDKNQDPRAADDPEWRRVRTNADVEFYCGTDRFVLPPGRVAWIDTAMGDSEFIALEVKIFKIFYELNYDLETGVGTNIIARTTNSDYINKRLRIQDLRAGRQGNIRDPRYSTPRQNFANHIDISPWFVDQENRAQWPSMNKARIELVQGDEFSAQYVSGGKPGARCPIDALRTFGLVLLHELTHTVQGGYLDDLPDKDNCYGWKCIRAGKNPRNADTIAMLGLALKLWKLGYAVDESGYIHSI